MMTGRVAEIAEDGPNLAMMGGEQGAKRQKVSSEEVREFLAGAAPTLQPDRPDPPAEDPTSSRASHARQPPLGIRPADPQWTQSDG